MQDILWKLWTYYIYQLLFFFSSCTFLVIFSTCLNKLLHFLYLWHQWKTFIGQTQNKTSPHTHLNTGQTTSDPRVASSNWQTMPLAPHFSPTPLPPSPVTFYWVSHAMHQKIPGLPCNLEFTSQTLSTHYPNPWHISSMLSQPACMSSEKTHRWFLFLFQDTLASQGA